MRTSPATLFLLFGFLLCVCPAAVAQEISALEPGRQATRQLRVGDRHSYSLPLPGNQAIEIRCGQIGVDVVITAIDPNGRIISVSNGPPGFGGVEHLFFVADAPGSYRIDVEVGRPGTGAGSYTLIIGTTRTPNENDAARAEAMKLSGETRGLLQTSEGRFERATQATAKLDRAIVLFEKADDRQGMANALFHLGNITGIEFGDEPGAIEAFEKALRIWRTLDDEAGKATCLAHAGRELVEKGDHEKALTFLNEALAINRKLNDRPGEAVTLSFLCRLYNNTQKFQQGFEACRESRRLGQDADPMSDYFTYSALAALSCNTGDMDRCLELYNVTVQRVLMAGSHLNPIRLATAKSNIAGIFFSRKNYPDALANYDEALLVSQRVNRPKFEAYFLGQMAAVFYEMKHFAKALEHGERSVALYRQHYHRNRQFALRILGNIYVEVGQNDKARETLAEALAMNLQNKDRYAEAETRYDLARLESRIGTLERALEYVREAINISETLRGYLFGKHQRTSYFTILRRYYEKEIELLVASYDRTSRPEYLERAWQDQERIRARSLLENLLQSGYEFEDPNFASSAKIERDLAEAISAAELKRSEAVRANDPSAAAIADSDLRKRIDEYELFHEQVRKRNPRFSALGFQRDFSFADVREMLDVETALVEFSVGEKQSYAWIIDRSSAVVVKLPSRDRIDLAARDFYLALAESPGQDLAAVLEKSQRLSREVLHPLSRALSAHKRVVIVADGSLQLIPFSALTLTPDAPFQPLGERVEIVNAPSFASLKLLRENQAGRTNRPDKLLAVFADPIFQSDDERLAKRISKPASDAIEHSAKLTEALSFLRVNRLGRLPFSGIEAKEIARLEPEGTTIVLGAKASRRNVLSGDYSSFRILHFATHGFLNNQNPDLSGLVFSLFDENRQPQNGFLRVIDVYSLQLQTDLVVLSACQTAVGKDVDGEGIVGLTRSFMHAGASSVISSLWKVEDAATAELMKRFYRSLLKEKQTPAAALRQAQQELRQIPRFSNPRHWAGFTFTGGPGKSVPGGPLPAVSVQPSRTPVL